MKIAGVSCKCSACEMEIVFPLDAVTEIESYAKEHGGLFPCPNCGFNTLAVATFKPYLVKAKYSYVKSSE